MSPQRSDNSLVLYVNRPSGCDIAKVRFPTFAVIVFKEKVFSVLLEEIQL